MTQVLRCDCGSGVFANKSSARYPGGCVCASGGRGSLDGEVEERKRGNGAGSLRSWEEAFLEVWAEFGLIEGEKRGVHAVEP